MQKTPDRQETIRLLKSRFMFGTQYFRPPTPLPEEWEGDLDKIKALGMDHIRLWALWCAVEPKEGRFDLSAYDRLIEMAGARGLGVCVNFILDHVPVWAGRKHRACLISKEGTPYRKELLFGGHFACWDNPDLRAQAEPFIRAFVERYRDKPQLLIWDVWNEVKYYRCWCPHSSRAFADFLLRKHGSLDAVNRACGTCFGEPDEIELPFGETEICLNLEANEFERTRLNQQIAWVRDTVLAVDPVTPVMTHSHSWGSVTKGIPMWDDWTVRKEVDLWGASQHIIYYQNQHAARNRFAYTIANIESKRATGHYWLSELTTGIMRGGVNGLRNRVAEGELTFNMWTYFAHGAKGFTFWQFRPERYSAEAPGWGLINLDGAETCWTQEARRFREVLERQREFMERAAPPKPRVGILYDPRSSVLHAIMKRSDYTRCFHGTVFALWVNSVGFQILRDFDDFAGYDLILLPGSLALPDEALEKLLRYVEAGGTAVIEAGFGSYRPSGFYRTNAPGDALHARFGYKETDILPLFDKDVSAELETTGLTVHNLPVRIPMQIGERFLQGSYDYRRVEPLSGTEVIGRYPDGQAAVLRRKIGKGTMLYFGAVLGPDLLESDDIPKTRTFLGALGLKSDVAFTAEGGVTASVMEHGAERWIIFFNHDRAESSIHLPAGMRAEPVFESTPTWPELRFEAKGVKVLRVRS